MAKTRYWPYLEHILIEEADRMGEFFLSQKNEPFLVQTLFNLVILNVLWTIVAGKRYDNILWQSISLFTCLQFFVETDFWKTNIGYREK